MCINGENNPIKLNFSFTIKINYYIMELEKTRDLIWKLSAQDRTRIMAELIEKYDLDKYANVYCCDICDKTGQMESFSLVKIVLTLLAVENVREK